MTAETQQAIDGGLAYPAAQDNRDGSFGSMASSRRRVAVTALAGMAFLSSGNTPGRGKYGAHVQRAVDFLLSRVQPNGFIFDDGNTGHGPMYDHGFATLFLAEVYGMTKTPRCATACSGPSSSSSTRRTRRGAGGTNRTPRTPTSP